MSEFMSHVSLHFFASAFVVVFLYFTNSGTAPKQTLNQIFILGKRNLSPERCYKRTSTRKGKRQTRTTNHQNKTSKVSKETRIVRSRAFKITRRERGERWDY